MRLTALSPHFTFSHKAALIAARRLEPLYGKVEIQFKPGNIGVLEDVQFRRCLGVVAFRNSSKRADIVPQVVKEYWFLKNNGAQIFAIGEIKLRIRHQVMVREHVRHPHQVNLLVTHPHAKDQCRNITRLGIRAPYVEATSTAEAARLIAADDGFRNAAAIAPREAAEGYGLKILLENVEDESNNVTRFHILSTKPADPTGNDKTALIFQGENTPHAVHRLRDIIGIDGKDPPFIRPLTPKEAPILACYCEFSAHRDTPDGHRVLNALRAAGTVPVFIGSYPKPQQEPE